MPDVESKRPFQLSEALEFRPRFWWDPVPPWLFETLRPEFVRELAAIQMEFSKVVLEAQVKATERALAVVHKIK